MLYDNYFFTRLPFIPANCEKPPTIYSILESIVNYGKDEKTKIKDLAKEGRSTIFNFEYPLSANITKEKFECMILNHFLMRRIGFETVTAFRIQLDVKLNEIMPMYNKLFDAIDGWNIFESGEVIERVGNNSHEISNTTENTLDNSSQTTSVQTSDRRNSELPQNQLSELRDGNYVSNYNYDQNNSTSNDNSNSTANSNSTTNDENDYTETITKTPADKLSIFKEFQTNIKSVYAMIFDELECLFYQII